MYKMKIKDINIASVLYILFVIVTVGGRVIACPPLIANLMIALVGFCALLFCCIKKWDNKYNIYALFGGALFSLLMIFSMLHNNNADIYDLAWIWSYLGIAMLLYEFDIPNKLLWWVVYILLFLLCGYILVGGDAGSLLTNGSQNNISAFFIFFVLIAYLGERNTKKSLNYLIPFFTLAICLWTGSRAGVVSALILVLCVFFYNFIAGSGNKTKLLVKFIVLICVALIILFVFFNSYLSEFIEKVIKYKGGSIRTTIWSEYLVGSVANFKNFLLGVDMSPAEYHWLNFYHWNVHNSFLMLHAKFGIAAVILLAALIFKAIRKIFINSDFIVLIVLVVASARMFFDWIAFPGLYDVIFWYLTLYILDKAVKMK